MIGFGKDDSLITLGRLKESLEQVLRTELSNLGDSPFPNQLFWSSYHQFVHDSEAIFLIIKALNYYFRFIIAAGHLSLDGYADTG